MVVKDEIMQRTSEDVTVSLQFIIKTRFSCIRRILMAGEYVPVRSSYDPRSDEYMRFDYKVVLKELQQVTIV